MKKLLISLFLLVSVLSYGQETTTFILVRHAEKASDGTKNPSLTTEGEARAQLILELFERTDITAIYSTDFKRTRMTIAPLAENKGLDIQIYEWKNPKALLNRMLESNPGGTIIISGHSNTTPVLANLLMGKVRLTQFEDDDYGNLLIITTTKIGEGKLLHMRFSIGE